MDVPLWSEIRSRLWVGGTPVEDWLEPDPLPRPDPEHPFTAAVTLFQYARPFAAGVMELRFPFPDDYLPEDDPVYERVERLAAWAFQEWTRGETVLIRCQAGQNRSGLVAARVLMFSGMTADDAVELLRARRSPYVLGNRAFVRRLHAVGRGLA